MNTSDLPNQSPEISGKFACNYDPNTFSSEQRERYPELLQQLSTLAEDVIEEPNGFAIRYAPDPSVVMLVAEFITLANLCCPFLNLTMELESDGGPCWFRLNGEEGTKEFLKLELGLPKSMALKPEE